MARRMDRKVIKLEAALGSERQFIVVTRKQDLIVRDVMEEVQKVFKIPIEVQTLFHKGTNLCDFMDHTLEIIRSRRHDFGKRFLKTDLLY